MQNKVPSDTISDYQADVSALALEANVETHVTNSLNSYDPPTKAEMDASFAALNDPTAASIADAVWDETASEHIVTGTFGDKLQNKVPSDSVDDYKADVSALATTSALNTHDTDIKAAISGLNDPTASAIVAAVMAKSIDGTIDVEELFKILSATFAGDMEESSDGNTVTYKDQSDTVKVSEDFSVSNVVTRTIS